MNRILILLIIDDLLEIPIISIMIDYYYNSNKVFNNPKKIIKINIRDNIGFNKTI